MRLFLRHISLAFAVAVVACGTVMASTPPDAASTIQVQKAWIRILPAGLPAGGYAVIHNTGAIPRKLTSVSSSAYASAMLHRTVEKAGVSDMHMVTALSIPAHGDLRLVPGHYHLMFMHATRAIHPGDTVAVTLHFADGSTLKVNFAAMPANSAGPPNGG